MKKIVALVALATCVLALAAAPALAEGYNNGGWNFGGYDSSTNSTYAAGDYTGTYAKNAGIYVRSPQAGSDQEASMQGPHGGYNTTTNKCQDCHSTHYATGSYMLLRANNRENACSFCHAGGGGSKINIQMDNLYDQAGVVATTTRGLGTGHTMGYEGQAPADINPAFQSADGFACFDCHSPHGNSARIMTTFSDPGRAVYDAVAAGVVGAVASDKYFYVTDIFYFSGAANYNTVDFNESAYGLPALTDPTTGKTVYDLNAVTSADVSATTPATYGGLLGVTPEGNVVFKRKDGDPTQSGAQPDASAIFRPVWTTGRFLLLKNPDNELVGGVKVPDTSVAATGTTADNGVNKLAINWDDPLGPADFIYGAGQDRNRNDAAWNSTTKQWEFNGDGAGTTVAFPGAYKGILSEPEFCTDCHDGAAGASTQRANVWYDNGYTQAGTYVAAYSHDAQPRH